MKEIRGIVLPSPTVFCADGSVDEKLMRELTDWFIACGVHSFSFSAPMVWDRRWLRRNEKKLRRSSFGRTICEGMRLRGFDVKMYPRWPSKPLTLDAYLEMRDLFTELKIIDAPAAARRA